MIQRKQSLYLLAIFALMVTMLFMPLATLTVAGDNQEDKVETAADGSIIKTTFVAQSDIELNVWGVYTDGKKDVPLVFFAILTCLTTAVSFVTIFLYRKRMLQLRLCFVMAVMIIGMISYIGLYIYKLNSLAASQDFTAIKYSVADIFPLFALAFTWLAYRGITADIALLRSLDRIR